MFTSLNKGYVIVIFILLIAFFCYLRIILYLKYRFSITSYYGDKSVANQSDINLSNDVDVRGIDYNICYIKSDRIVFSSHHKSGTNLFKEMISPLQSYVNQNCKTTIKTQHICCPGHLPATIGRINSHLHPEQNGIGILLHINRDPVNMILSGYNYHKYLTIEPWTYQMNIDQLREYIHNKNKQTDNEDYYQCYSKLFYKNDQNNIIYDTYIAGNKYVIQNIYHQSIRYVLSNVMDQQHGIIWEYERWRCLEGPEMLETFQYVQKLKNNKSSNIIAENFYLEQFKADYNQSCYKILDMFSIYEQNDRDELMDKLIKYDQNSLKYAVDNTLIINHTTQGLYDRDSEIDILLKDPQRCLYLKNVTNTLQMNWGFHRYC